MSHPRRQPSSGAPPQVPFCVTGISFLPRKDAADQPEETDALHRRPRGGHPRRPSPPISAQRPRPAAPSTGLRGEAAKHLLPLSPPPAVLAGFPPPPVWGACQSHIRPRAEPPAEGQIKHRFGGNRFACPDPRTPGPGGAAPPPGVCVQGGGCRAHALPGPSTRCAKGTSRLYFLNVYLFTFERVQVREGQRGRGKQRIPSRL